MNDNLVQLAVLAAIIYVLVPLPFRVGWNLAIKRGMNPLLAVLLWVLPFNWLGVWLIWNRREMTPEETARRNVERNAPKPVPVPVPKSVPKKAEEKYTHCQACKGLNHAASETCYHCGKAFSR